MDNINKLTNKENFIEGFRDGIPIALGYFAVAFSLGITAKNVGLNPFQGFLISFLNKASAGEYAAFQAIGNSEAYIQLAILTLITNARYFLMSGALTQKVDPNMPFFHRFFMIFDLTDEIFGIAISRNGYVNPFYIYGAAFIAVPAWSIATAFGVVAGNILSPEVVRALSVSLYGMFLAIIFPQAKKDSAVLLFVLISFIASFIWDLIPMLKIISGGTKIIILTLAISAIAAIAYPIKDEVENE